MTRLRDIASRLNNTPYLDMAGEPILTSPYVSPAEGGYEPVLEQLQNGAAHEGILFGYAGLLNLDLFAAGRFSGALLCDINAGQTDFWNTLLPIMAANPTLDGLEKALSSESDTAIQEVLEIIKSERGHRSTSCFYSDETYGRVSAAIANGDIAPLTLSVLDNERHRELANALEADGKKVDLIYMSNIPRFMKDNGFRNEGLPENAAEMMKDTVLLLAHAGTAVMDASQLMSTSALAGRGYTEETCSYYGPAEEWSQFYRTVPFIERVAKYQDDVSLPVRTLVQYLEKRIQQDFDLTLLMGLEKEGILDADRGALTNEEFMKKFNDERKARIPKSMKPIHHRIYAELDDDQSEVAMAATSPSSLIRRTDVQTMYLPSLTKAGVEEAEALMTPNEKKAREAYTAQLNDLQFTPYRRHEGSTLGTCNSLHTNISPWHHKQGHLPRNIIHSFPYPGHPLQHLHNHLFSAFARTLNTMMATDIILIAPSDDAFKRLNEKKDALVVTTKGEDLEQTARFEFRVPSSDTRNDLVVLFTLVAMYESLHALTKGKWKEGCPAPHAHDFQSCIPAKSYTEAQAAFENKSEFFTTLKNIIPKDHELRATVETLEKTVKKHIHNHTLTQPGITELVSASRS